MRQAMVVAGVLLLALGTASAQQSTNFQVTEYSVGGGGPPTGGTVPASPNFQLSFAAVGEMAAGTSLSSPSFQMDSGFVASFPPPGEVQGLLFTDQDHLAWDPEPSVGTYQLYRDLFSTLSSLDYGLCEQQELEDAATAAPEVPPPADGYFYLVTARNRLDEEGTKGLDSAGVERENLLPCP